MHMVNGRILLRGEDGAWCVCLGSTADETSEIAVEVLGGGTSDGDEGGFERSWRR